MAGSHGAQPVTVLLLALDGFQGFSEGHGPQAADTVLGEWVRFLKSKLRRTDLLGRYGGEEVVVGLKGRPASRAQRSSSACGRTWPRRSRAVWRGWELTRS
ncbi:MAG: diguanylate cyclase [Chloroflexi bacterium]|nr:diguanylate cyclase [Chloroflexota bacterium]